MWGYVIEDEHGEEVDSCWGFYGYENCKEQARSQAEYFQRDKEAAMREMLKDYQHHQFELLKVTNMNRFSYRTGTYGRCSATLSQWQEKSSRSLKMPIKAGSPRSTSAMTRAYVLRCISWPTSPAHRASLTFRSHEELSFLKPAWRKHNESLI